MVNVRDVPSAKFIEKLKEELKKVDTIKPLPWIHFVKTGSHKERPPEQKDFWHIRSASILKKIYLDGPVGTSRLKTFYGSRRRRGHKPAKSRKAGGNLIRKILQQLEIAGFIEKGKKGRKITSKGQKLLDKVAYEVSK